MYRLIYKSRSTRPLDWESIGAILESSHKHNPGKDITGVLLATRTHFLQVLEGSFESVNALYHSIVRDPRHDTLQLVTFTCVEHRVFQDWEMHGIGLFDFHHELTHQLKQAYGEEGGEVRLPTQEWEALALIKDVRQIHD